MSLLPVCAFAKGSLEGVFTSPALLHQLIGSVHADHQVSIVQSFHEILGGNPRQIARCYWAIFVADAPDAAAEMIPAGMVQPHLIMSDDAVVKICHIKRAIRPELNVYRTKPGVITSQEIRHLDSGGTGAVPL